MSAVNEATKNTMKTLILVGGIVIIAMVFDGKFEYGSVMGFLGGGLVGTYVWLSSD